MEKGEVEDDHWAVMGEFDRQQCERVSALKQVSRLKIHDAELFCYDAFEKG